RQLSKPRQSGLATGTKRPQMRKVRGLDEVGRECDDATGPGGRISLLHDDVPRRQHAAAEERLARGVEVGAHARLHEYQSPRIRVTDALGLVEERRLEDGGAIEAKAETH